MKPTVCLQGLLLRGGGRGDVGLGLNQKLYGSKSYVNSLLFCLFFLPTTAIPSWFKAEALRHECSTPGLVRHGKCWKFHSVVTEFLPLWEAWGSFQISLVTWAAPRPGKLTSWSLQRRRRIVCYRSSCSRRSRWGKVSNVSVNLTTGGAVL